MAIDPESLGDAKILVSALDSTLHQPTRLGILILLHLHSSLPFSVIQKGLELTSGNLNTYLTRLERAKLVEKEKAFVNLRPRTLVHITTEGRNSLISYANTLKHILLEIRVEKL